MLYEFLWKGALSLEVLYLWHMSFDSVLAFMFIFVLCAWNLRKYVSVIDICIWKDCSNTLDRQQGGTASGRAQCGYGIGLEKSFPSLLLGLFVTTFSKGQKFFYLSGSNHNFLLWILQKTSHCSKESVQLCSPQSVQMFSMAVDAS